MNFFKKILVYLGFIPPNVQGKTVIQGHYKFETSEGAELTIQFNMVVSALQDEISQTYLRNHSYTFSFSEWVQWRYQDYISQLIRNWTDQYLVYRLVNNALVEEMRPAIEQHCYNNYHTLDFSNEGIFIENRYISGLICTRNSKRTFDFFGRLPFDYKLTQYDDDHFQIDDIRNNLAEEGIDASDEEILDRAQELFPYKYGACQHVRIDTRSNKTSVLTSGYCTHDMHERHHIDVTKIMPDGSKTKETYYCTLDEYWEYHFYNES